MTLKALELLAPAGTPDIGIAAIDHGADAVYIGAPRFSARAAAGADLDGIARLVRHAHFFRARVYVALNTILADDELPEALGLCREIHALGADGLIIQDVGLLELDLPPIPLIASTQMHNHTPERIAFLERVGFRRVILARELALEEIAAIRRATAIELESFVHGALCVSYSGRCYMSQAVAARSGNRGVCAQPCRGRYTLLDGRGRVIESDRHLLSLRDLCLINDLPALAGAGVTSFKIEGRYKGIEYVKNITAAYSRALDAFIAGAGGYRRASSGRCDLHFEPDPRKTFNRGYTRFFLPGGRPKIASLDTQKSIGEPVGAVTRLGAGCFETDGARLQNGDGLCFFTRARTLAGFRVERVEGDRVYPSTMKGLRPGTRLYRNLDIAFNRLLRRATGRRRIGVEMDFAHDGDVVRLAVRDEDGHAAAVEAPLAFEPPLDAGRSLAQVRAKLATTGNTPFAATEVRVAGPVGFYPLSFLNRLKRDALEALARVRTETCPRDEAPFVPNDAPFPEPRLDYHANVLNRSARRFYERHGAEVVEGAFETLPDPVGREVMTSRYCLRRELDACPRYGGARLLEEPLRIRDDGHTYLLRFDCDACRMSVILEKKR